METIFIQFLNRSLSASVLILAVVLLRPLLQRAPRWTSLLLWAMVALRLIVPFSIESRVSLIPAAEPIPVHIAQMPSPAVETGIPAVNQAVNPVLVQRFAPDPISSVNPLQVVQWAAALLWMAGILGMLLFLLLSFLRAKRSVRAAIPLTGQVYVCDEVRSPFVLGLIRPRIYLPSDLDEKTRESVLLHEQAHLQRRDHWWKPLGFLILAVHWFNPLCWLAYILFCRDIEAACDEKVIALMDGDGRAAYSQALLDCSRPQRVVTVCPLAFGETGVKSRIQAVLRYRKPLLRAVVAALTVLVIVAVCFLTDPQAVRETQAAETAPETTSAPVAQPGVADTAAPAMLSAESDDAAPSPTPWAGNGHWYTFQPLPWGVMSSTNTKYLALDGPYFVAMKEDAVAIGKIKGVLKEVKMYTRDPEERLIWANEPGVFWGTFLRDDVKLTEPDPKAQPLSLWLEDTEVVLSDDARTELLSLLDAVPTSGQTFQESDAETDMESIFAYITCAYDDLPGLHYWLMSGITRYDGRLILVTMKEDAVQGGYAAESMIEIDPDSALAQAYDRSVQRP